MLDSDCQQPAFCLNAEHAVLTYVFCGSPAQLWQAHFLRQCSQQLLLQDCVASTWLLYETHLIIMLVQVFYAQPSHHHAQRYAGGRRPQEP